MPLGALRNKQRIFQRKTRMIHNSDFHRQRSEFTVKSHKERAFLHTTSILIDCQHKVKAFPVV